MHAHKYTSFRCDSVNTHAKPAGTAYYNSVAVVVSRAYKERGHATPIVIV